MASRNNFVFNEANKAQVLELQKSCYSERVGKVYGDFEVTEVWYNWETRKQMWRLKCILCGAEKVTHNGRDYRKGRNKGICDCRTEKAKLEKIAEKQKRAENKTDFQDIVGKVIGGRVVAEYIPNKGYLVQCDICNKSTILPRAALISESPTICACKAKSKVYTDKIWVGKKYGHLTITGYTDKHFDCVCDCLRTVRIKPTFLIGSRQLTCGNENCKYHNKVISEKNKTHGKSGTRLYNVWSNMLDRCNNPKNTNYVNYGGRGITVCDEWKNDFETFCRWAMKSGYDESAERSDCTIDRKNNDKGYSPDNCRWVNMKVQANNKRPHKAHKRKLTWEIKGETKSAIEWCKQYGLSVPFALYRINKKGMTPEQALTTPKLTKGRPTTQP